MLLILYHIDTLIILFSFRVRLSSSFYWVIWLVRNDAIFQHVQPSLHHGKMIFKTEFAQVGILRAKQKYEPLISQWLKAYV